MATKPDMLGPLTANETTLVKSIATSDRFDGHLLKGRYDVHNGSRDLKAATSSPAI